jgi:BlaI family penicillinase repressor
MGRDNKLSEFELDVMNLLWELEKASAPQLHELVSKTKNVSYSTVKTIVDRLEQKSAILRAEQHGRTILYAPAVSRESMSKPLLKGFLNRMFNGKPKSMIAQLLDNEDLSDADIDTLQKMLEQKKGKNS